MPLVSPKVLIPGTAKRSHTMPQGTHLELLLTKTNPSNSLSSLHWLGHNGKVSYKMGEMRRDEDEGSNRGLSSRLRTLRILDYQRVSHQWQAAGKRKECVRECEGSNG